MGVKVRFRRGSWWVYIDHQGRRRAKHVGDRQTAHEVARRIRKALAERSFELPLADSSPTVADYAAAWLKTGESTWKASTHRFYRFNVNLHIVPTLGQSKVASLRRRDCKSFVAACRAKGLKRASVTGVNRTLSALLSQAVEDELLPANPAFRMGRHLRGGDDLPFEVEPLTRDEAQRLLTTAAEKFPAYYPLLLCALRTGLRLGEILALEWPQVNLRDRYLDVRRSRVGGKMSTPKNKQRRRVDMSQQLTETLRRLRVSRRKAALKAGRPMAPTVFLSPEGQPLDGDNFRTRVFYRLLEQAEVRRVRVHDVRHTFASHLIQNGESLAYVQQQLGHSSIQVTVDVYGHLVPGANRAAVDRLDAPIRNPRATKRTGSDA